MPGAMPCEPSHRGLVLDGARTRTTDPETLAKLLIDVKKGRLKKRRKKRRRRDAD